MHYMHDFQSSCMIHECNAYMSVPKYFKSVIKIPGVACDKINCLVCKWVSDIYSFQTEQYFAVSDFRTSGFCDHRYFPAKIWCLIFLCKSNLFVLPVILWQEMTWGFDMCQKNNNNNQWDSKAAVIQGFVRIWAKNKLMAIVAKLKNWEKPDFTWCFTGIKVILMQDHSAACWVTTAEQECCHTRLYYPTFFACI